MIEVNGNSEYSLQLWVYPINSCKITNANLNFKLATSRTEYDRKSRYQLENEAL